MYNPTRFRRDDEASILSLVAANPLATVISPSMISHLPLIVEKREGRIFLVGHLAKANPHWKVMDAVTVVFHGPQAYITPRWYAQNDVPTWNYAVVHMRGRARVSEDYEAIVTNLQKLSAQMDPAWEFWVPPDLDGRLTVAIAAFEIEVEEIDAKFKLNQNRSAADRDGVVRGLTVERGDDESRAVARLMSEEK